MGIDEHNNMEYYSAAEASNRAGITTQTLRLWIKNGVIESIKSGSGRHRISKTSLHRYIGVVDDPPKKIVPERVVCIRVSSTKQKDDLERQREWARSTYPDYAIVEDIGSGLNWKRKGLRTILEWSESGGLKAVMVAHRDRLCRFAYELLEYILSHRNTKLMVHDQDIGKSGDIELSDDILSIIHIYSCRKMGRRRYTTKSAPSPDLSNGVSSDTIQEVD